MSAVTNVTIKCDNEGCGAVFPDQGGNYPLAGAARKDARAEGWSTFRRDGDSSGDHCNPCTRGVPVAEQDEDEEFGDEFPDEFEGDEEELPSEGDEEDELADLL